MKDTNDNENPPTPVGSTDLVARLSGDNMPMRRNNITGFDELDPYEVRKLMARAGERIMELEAEMQTIALWADTGYKSDTPKPHLYDIRYIARNMTSATAKSEPPREQNGD